MPVPLNDTGLDWCADDTSDQLTCPVSGFPEQDAQYGRDFTHYDENDGHAGFSFTKISNSGDPLSNTATLGSGANAWGCTCDNVTGLMWEVKTDVRGLRYMGWTYTWFNSVGATNGGSAGKEDEGSGDANFDCYDSTRCDTEKYVEDVNDEGLCGFSDWRLPNRFELESITRDDTRDEPDDDPDDDIIRPAINKAFFPTHEGWVWSSSPTAYDGDYAWGLNFDTSEVGYYPKSYARNVWLVRDGNCPDLVNRK